MIQRWWRLKKLSSTFSLSFSITISFYLIYTKALSLLPKSLRWRISGGSGLHLSRWVSMRGPPDNIGTERTAVRQTSVRLLKPLNLIITKQINGGHKHNKTQSNTKRSKVIMSLFFSAWFLLCVCVCADFPWKSPENIVDLPPFVRQQ